jgi:hypothetical protein
MQKVLLLLLGVFGLLLPSHAQRHKEIPKLAPFEAHLLDSLLRQKRGAFTFYDKRVAFFTGNRGSTPKPKSEFFQRYVLPLRQPTQVSGLSLWVIKDTEREQAGGCDAVVFAWVKIQPAQQQVLKRAQRYASR